MANKPYLIPTETERITTPLDSFKQKFASVGSWFKEEMLELTFGESEGRPSMYYVLRREYLTRFLENGWTVSAVLESTERGVWKTVGNSKRDNTSRSERTEARSESSGSTNKTASTDHSESVSHGENSSTNRTTQGSTYKTDEQRDYEGTSGTASSNYAQTIKHSDESYNNNEAHSTTDSNSSSDSEKKSESNDSHSSNSKDNIKDAGSSSENTDTESVAAYWAAYQRIRLTRRRLVPELVLQSMLDNFTDAYNKGKANDDERYEQVISLYATTLAKTEAEMERLIDDGLDLENLFNLISTRLNASIAEAKKSAKQVGDAGLAAALDEIKRKFDAELSRAKSELISAGMFNGSVWISVSAGIERNRQVAIIAARSEMAKSGVDANLAVVSAETSAYNTLAEIRKATVDLLDKRRISATEMRNNVVKIFAEIIASKKEDAPQLESFAQLVQTFGFSVGAAGNVL